MQQQAGKGDEDDDIGDLETGVAQWRARGLPAEQGAKSARWGASYGLQFRILFIRCNVSCCCCVCLNSACAWLRSCCARRLPAGSSQKGSDRHSLLEPLLPQWDCTSCHVASSRSPRLRSLPSTQRSNCSLLCWQSAAAACAGVHALVWWQAAMSGFTLLDL